MVGDPGMWEASRFLWVVGVLAWEGAWAGA